MPDARVGDRVRFTDPQGRARVGVVKDHADPNERLTWMGKHSWFVKTDDELPTRWYWTYEVRPDTDKDPT